MNRDGQPVVAKRKVTSKIDYLPSTSASGTTSTPTPRPGLRSSPSVAAFARTTHQSTSPASSSSTYNTPTSAPTGRTRAKVNLANIASPSPTPASGLGLSPLPSPGSTISNVIGSEAGYTSSPLGTVGNSFAYFGDNGRNGSVNADHAGRSEVGTGKATIRRFPTSSTGETSIKPTVNRAMTTPDIRRTEARSSGSTSSSVVHTRSELELGGQSQTRTPISSSTKPPTIRRTPSSQTLGGRSNTSNTYTTPTQVPPLPKSGQQIRSNSVVDVPPNMVRAQTARARLSNSIPNSPDVSSASGPNGPSGLSVSPSSSVNSSLMSGGGRPVRSSTGRASIVRAPSPLPPDPSTSPNVSHGPMSSRQSATISPGSGTTYRPGSSLGSRSGSAHQDGSGTMTNLEEEYHHQSDVYEGDAGTGVEGAGLTEREWRIILAMRRDEAPKVETEEEREERERLEEEKEVAEDAKKDRKIADLEISNQSLMTVNRTLEAAAARKDRLISGLKRQLRASERGGGGEMDLAFKPLKTRRSERSLWANSAAPDGTEEDDGLLDLSETDEYTSDEGESLVTRHATAIDATLAKLNDSLAALARRGREALERVETTTEGEKGKVLGVLDLEGADEEADAGSGEEGGAATPDTKEDGQLNQL